MIRLQLRELHFGILKKLAKIEFAMNNFIIVLILKISLIFLDDLVPEPNWPNWVIFIKNLEMMSEASIQRRKRVDKVRVRQNYGYNFLKKLNLQITSNRNNPIMKNFFIRPVLELLLKIISHQNIENFCFRFFSF